MREQGPSAGHDHKSMADSVLTFESSLLTPPLSIDNNEPPPFKPPTSDSVSLSMKKPGRSARQRRRLNRACASSGDVNGEHKKPTQTEHKLIRKSLPDLKKYRRLFTHSVLSEPRNHAWVDQKLQQLSSERDRGSSNARSFDSRQISGLNQRPRRWTVPSKSRPAHLVCFTNHMTHTSTLQKSCDEQSAVTPAMIVLRRATTTKERARSITQTNITFFPPPKFTRTTTSLLSFLRMAPQQSQERVNCLNTNASMMCSSSQSLVPSPPRRPSVTNERAQPGCSVTAEPAVTDVMVYSAREHDATHQFDGPGHRRFSTKIISQSSVHEIIWDENVVSGESNSSSSNISRKPTKNKKREEPSQPRKQSIAVEKLETQLRRDSSDPRRALPENPSELHRIHQTSLQSLLNFKFGEAKARSGDLRGLPRSRASLSSAAPRVNDELSCNPRRKTQGEPTGVCNDVEFFPQLGCRASRRSLEQLAILKQGRPDGTAYSNRKSSMGCNLGPSRHMRRKSAANYYHHVERARCLARPTDEHMPLLSQTGLDGTNAEPNSPRQGQVLNYQPTSAAKADRSDPLNTHPRMDVFHIHRRRFCGIYEFRNHKRCIATVKHEVQALKETVSTMKDAKATVLNETDSTSPGWFMRHKGGPQQYDNEGDVAGQSAWQPVGKTTDKAAEGAN